MPELGTLSRRRAASLAGDRLIANGKKPLVALTALMRKLITIINARIRDARKPIPLGAKTATAELS